MQRTIHTSLFITLLTASSIFCQTNISIKTYDIGALFIEGINATSTERQKEIISQVMSQSSIENKGMEALVNLFHTLHTSYSPMEYHHSDIVQFDKPSGTVYVMHVFAKKKGETKWLDFQMYVDAPPIHKIKNLAFIAEVSEPVNLPNGTIQQKETLEWLNNYISKLNNEFDLSGSILIAQGEQILFERYWGYADPEKTRPIDASSLFNIASGGKMFTALSIAKLVQGNKLNYNDQITEYIDEFSDPTKADKILIHNLLSHTSGLTHHWWGQKSEASEKSKTVKDDLKMIIEGGFQAAAGTAYEYNNSNYILLGAVIEKITGKDYYTFVAENIFVPANMKSSGYFNHGTEKTVAPLVRAEQSDKWIRVENEAVKGSAAGGAYSNARDMLKFSRALRNNLIVSEETFQNMVAVKNKGMDVSEDYGYGFIIEKSGPEITYGHGGTAKGVNFEFRYFPNQDITLVVFCNQDNGAYDDLKRNAIKLISGDR